MSVLLLSLAQLLWGFVLTAVIGGTIFLAYRYFLDITDRRRRD